MEFDFWKKTILIVVFFVATPLTLFTALLSLFLVNNNNTQRQVLAANTTRNSGVQVFASLPSDYPSISQKIEAADSRVEMVKQYLEYYGSDLAPYAKTIVDVSNNFGIDFRLLPSIAQQESNLCKKIPAGSFNCWGWGIHSEGSLGFGSYEEAIWTVARGLKEEYIDQGYVTPEEIMAKYTPLSKGSWAEGVTEFMSELE